MVIAKDQEDVVYDRKEMDFLTKVSGLGFYEIVDLLRENNLEYTLIQPDLIGDGLSSRYCDFDTSYFDGNIITRPRARRLLHKVHDESPMTSIETSFGPNPAGVFFARYFVENFEGFVNALYSRECRPLGLLRVTKEGLIVQKTRVLYKKADADLHKRVVTISPHDAIVRNDIKI